MGCINGMGSGKFNVGGGTTLQWVRIRGSRIIPITSCFGHPDIYALAWRASLSGRRLFYLVFCLKLTCCFSDVLVSALAFIMSCSCCTFYDFVLMVTGWQGSLFNLIHSVSLQNLWSVENIIINYVCFRSMSYALSEWEKNAMQPSMRKRHLETKLHTSITRYLTLLHKCTPLSSRLPISSKQRNSKFQLCRSCS